VSILPGVDQNLRTALNIYRTERRRLAGGEYPKTGCSCGFCDVVRAADLLYRRALEDFERRRGPVNTQDRYGSG